MARHDRTDDRNPDRRAERADGGVASSPHQPLRRPGNDVETSDALHAADLSDRGAAVEDHLRDRDSKGVAGGYDDSIDRDGAH
ncbi:MAG: hypothetical protein ACTHKZ_05940 [Lysobacteraceae bacterium]